MGLGLSMSHEIVRCHGGAIEVESESGHYTEMRITLPDHPPEDVTTPDGPLDGLRAPDDQDTTAIGLEDDADTRSH